MSIKTILAGFMGLVIVMLVGCGGGGGGENDPAPSPAVSNVTLGGTAAKGIINLGNVVAEELNTNGSVLAQVGSAITGTDGSYSLTVGSNYNGGPIRVTISADANTEMKCDVPLGCGPRSDGITDTDNPTSIDFGEWYKPGSLSMTALVAEAASNDTIGVNITPYTNLATSRAMAAGSLSVAGIYSANSEVSNLLGGIDILNTQPLDITDVTAIGSGTATEIAYAAFSAAIAALADTSGGNPDINGALTTLANSFTGGTIDADDGGTDDSVISLQEIVDGATGALGKAGTADTSGTLASLQADVDDATDGTVDPQPSPTTGGTALAKVKTFVGDVRTWGIVIEAETSAEGDVFGTQVDLASTATDSSMEFLVGPALGSALEVALKNASGTTATNLSAYTVGMAGDPQFTAGTIANSGGTITISGGVINGVAVNMSVLLPADDTTASTFNLGISSATFRSADTDVDITSGTITANLVSPYTVNWAAMDSGTAVDPDISGGTINLDVSLTQKQGMDGITPVPLDSNITFTGNISATLTNPVKDSFGNIAWITPSSLTLGGNISDTADNSFDASFTVNISNASRFTPVGELPLGTVKTDMVTWAYTDVSPVDGTTDTFTLEAPDRIVTVQWDSGTSTSIVTQQYFGDYSDNYRYYGPSGTASIVSTVNVIQMSLGVYNIYSWVNGEGEYFADLSTADFSTGGSADGVLTDPDFVLEDANRWLAGSAGLNFILQLAGLPQASVNISGDRTSFEAGTAVITIAYDSRKIVINSNFTNLTSTGSITVTNQDGVSMVVDDGFDASTGDIKYNGQIYASITRLSNGLTKITYIDGTFEIL